MFSRSPISVLAYSSAGLMQVLKQGIHYLTFIEQCLGTRHGRKASIFFPRGGTTAQKVYRLKVQTQLNVTPSLDGA